MATNQTGIAIVIKAFLPIGKDLDQQLAALTVVKTAHETGDYAALLAAAKIDEVKTEQKTRRVDDAPVTDLVSVIANATIETVAANNPLLSPQPEPGPAPDDEIPAPNDDAEDIPAFLKTKKPAKAA